MTPPIGWQDREISLEDVPDKVAHGSHVFIGNSATTATALVDILTRPDSNLLDLQMIHCMPAGRLDYLGPERRALRISSFFAYTLTSRKIQDGLADYTPLSFSQIPKLIAEQHLIVDVALIKVTPPNAQGFCSLGPGVDVTLDMLGHARMIIAEVSDSIPWTEGESTIHSDQISWWVSRQEPLPTAEGLFPVIMAYIRQETLAGLAQNVAALVPNGATVKLDLTPLSQAVVPYLKQHKNLGLHTDLLTDDLMQLIQDGVITNQCKTMDTGKTVVSHAVGSRALYDFIDRNPLVEFRPSPKINDFNAVRQLHKPVAIVSALKIDISGQVTTDSLGGKIFGGVGTASDSIRAVGYADGGVPIVVLPALSPSGKSNIVFALPEGSGVVITRAEMHYVVTEFGVAYLYGKTIRERALSLIGIAHPDHRAALLEQAKNSAYIHARQPGLSFRSEYPKQFECFHVTTSGRQIKVRPIKATDEDGLRDFFHKLSDQNVYMRYFSQRRSLPQRVLHAFSDIDYSVNMALVVLDRPADASHEIVAIAQWIMDPHDNIPEIAFQIRDDWQGEGLGRFLFTRLIDLARDYGLARLKADVLIGNKPMNKVFEATGLPYKLRSDIGVNTYIFDITREQSVE